ncbi:MAG: hypothetical protein ABR978_02145 [Dehalococcoidia bacterium]|jgi:hypothetical protein
MDFDFQLDLAEVTRSIEGSEVVAIYFPFLRKTLLIDARHSAVDPPMAKVVDMVATPEERFQSVRQLRPRFPRPESLVLIPWPKYVGSLVRLKIWERIVERFINLGFPETVKECEACYEELVALEKEEMRRALAGENYKSLWESVPGGWKGPDEEIGEDEA